MQDCSCNFQFQPWFPDRVCGKNIIAYKKFNLMDIDPQVLSVLRVQVTPKPHESSRNN